MVIHRNQQRLSPRLLSRLGAILFALMLVLLAIIVVVIGRGFDGIERDRVAERLQRAAGVMHAAAGDLNTSVTRHAALADTDEFIRGMAPEYIDAHLGAEKRANLGLDIVAFFRDDGSLVELIDDSELARNGAHDHSRLPAMLSAVARRGGGMQHIQSIEWLEEMPLMIATSPVIDAASQGKPVGWMVIARGLPGMGVGLHRTSHDGMQLHKAPVAASDTLRVSKQHDGQTRGSLSLAQWPAQLELTQKPTYAAYKQRTLLWAGVAMLVMLVLTLSALAWLLRNEVLSRLEHFARLAADLGASGSRRQRWPVKGKDELDQLALALNNMLDQADQRERQIDHLVRMDQLTGLGNRRHFLDSLQQAIDMRRQHGELHYAVLLINLDQFKEVMQVHGQRAGDRALIEIADRIKALLRGGDVAARLGNDEFAILLEDAPAEQAQAFAERVLSEICRGIAEGDDYLFLGASIGMCQVDVSSDPHRMLGCVNVAMHQARLAGGNRIESCRQCGNPPASPLPAC